MGSLGGGVAQVSSQFSTYVGSLTSYSLTSVVQHAVIEFSLESLTGLLGACSPGSGCEACEGSSVLNLKFCQKKSLNAAMPRAPS